ncbi:hypothetical protein AB0J01_28180 [Streptomyces sp. NPDC050204]|uniref:hypothetical protein n=1 Tax=Streptomyces sp. NPDC050204 TaxID=3155514 RepID=UPI0034406675
MVQQVHVKAIQRSARGDAVAADVSPCSAQFIAVGVQQALCCGFDRSEFSEGREPGPGTGRKSGEQVGLVDLGMAPERLGGRETYGIAVERQEAEDEATRGGFFRPCGVPGVGTYRRDVLVDAEGAHVADHSFGPGRAQQAQCAACFSVAGHCPVALIVLVVGAGASLAAEMDVMTGPSIERAGAGGEKEDVAGLGGRADA